MDPEELIPCPFDSTHMIRYKRFPYHVKQCKKNFPHHNKEQCPFNARHWVPKPELRHHISTCPDKRTIESEIEYENSKNTSDFYGGNVSVPPYNTQYAIDTSENWDDDSNHPTFVLGQTSKPQAVRNANTVEVETMFVPANRKTTQQEPAIEPDVRMPKNAPQVLQPQHRPMDTAPANQPLGRGYGRGYAVPANQSSSVQSYRGRGRGLMALQANQPGVAQFRSLSDVDQSSPPTQSKSSPINTLHKQVNGNLQSTSDSPYSSGSDSPIPAVWTQSHPIVQSVPSHQNARVNAQPRGVNAPVSWLGRGRVIPTGSESESPSPPAHQGSIGRGVASVTNQKRAVGVGRGYRPLAAVSTPVAGIRLLDSGGSNSPASMSDSDSLFENDIEKDKQRTERKLRKKLKQIEKLELKRLEGQPLLQEEQEKLSQKSEVTRELQIVMSS